MATQRFLRPSPQMCEYVMWQIIKTNYVNTANGIKAVDWLNLKQGRGLDYPGGPSEIKEFPNAEVGVRKA